MDIDTELFAYATANEKRALEAIIEHGECQKADKACGKARGWSSGCYNRVKSRAAKYGYAPGHFDDGVAPGYRMGKVTIQRGA